MQNYTLNEFLERYGIDTSTPDGKHRKNAILFISGLPMPFSAKAELTEFVVSERFFA